MLEVKYIKGVEETLTKEEVAAIFKRPAKTIYNWARGGKLPCFKDEGRHLRFRATEIEAYIRRKSAEMTTVEEREHQYLNELTKVNK